MYHAMIGFHFTEMRKRLDKVTAIRRERKASRMNLISFFAFPYQTRDLNSFV